jgi:uncharacterized protein YjbJ (UPF0337 family)
MTTLDLQLDEKQNKVEGTVTQAKGIVREQWGNLSDNKLTQLAGKKDQVVGQLQANYGNSWIVRHRGSVLMATAVIAFCTALAFIFIRSNTPPEQAL